MADGSLRIGTLGAARITPMALLRPARQVSGVAVTAVAARERSRAERFAAKHQISRVHGSYGDLLADPDIDAIYNPLPNSHHAEWTIRALEAGKHVLCEKPLAANASEAEQMREASEKSGRVLMEAFHWRYHPLAARMLEIVRSGELGDVRHLEAALCIPLLLPGDIRFRLDLAGGAMMDTGCYVMNMVRALAGAEPEVVSAHALLSSPGVDRRTEADLRFSDGRTGRISSSLFSRSLIRMSARVLGDAGELRVFNPLAPHFYHRLTVSTQDGRRRERLAGDSTYTCQLRAFRDAVRDGKAFPTTAADGVLNMRAIDAVYRAAGLTPRG
jgi:predicted dehydrogenase